MCTSAGCSQEANKMEKPLSKHDIVEMRYTIRVYLNQHGILTVDCFDECMGMFLFNLQSHTREHIFDMMAAEMKELYK